MFTVYITTKKATIVSIIMLVYLLYCCVSVYMYVFLYKTSLSVINQIKSINSKTTDTHVIIELSFNIPVKPGKKVLEKTRNS